MMKHERNNQAFEDKDSSVHRIKLNFLYSIHCIFCELGWVRLRVFGAFFFGGFRLLFLWLSFVHLLHLVYPGVHILMLLFFL